MNSQYLSLRLSKQELTLIEHLRSQTGLSKSEILKRALHQYVGSNDVCTAVSLFALGQNSFGRYGVVTRQSSDVKRVVRKRLQAKQR